MDDPFLKESRGDKVITRAMRLISHELCLSGQADTVEFYRLPEHLKSQGVLLDGHEGYWKPQPVEYKRGKPKGDQCDAVQLCAQAICLEEMLGVSIAQGDLFYGAIRRREKVIFEKELRDTVKRVAEQMLTTFLSGKTPAPSAGKQCKACSLIHICLPQLDHVPSVKTYIQAMLEVE